MTLPSSLPLGLNVSDRPSAAAHSDYFSTGNTVNLNRVVTDGTTDGRAAELVLYQYVAPGPDWGPHLTSGPNETYGYQYGRFEARIKTADCSTDPNAGVVSAFFTFFNNGTDADADTLPDNSEIDFEWLCAEPNVMYLTMYTDYLDEYNLRKVTRSIDLATGEIRETCYEVATGTCSQQLTGVEASPSSITPIPSYDSSQAFDDYGISWDETGVQWWIIDPADGFNITLWDYRGPSSRIITRPAHFMLNLWHTARACSARQARRQVNPHQQQVSVRRLGKIYGVGRVPQSRCFAPGRRRRLLDACARHQIDLDCDHLTDHHDLGRQFHRRDELPHRAFSRREHWLGRNRDPQP